MYTYYIETNKLIGGNEMKQKRSIWRFTLLIEDQKNTMTDIELLNDIKRYYEGTELEEAEKRMLELEKIMDYIEFQINDYYESEEIDHNILNKIN